MTLLSGLEDRQIQASLWLAGSLLSWLVAAHAVWFLQRRVPWFRRQDAAEAVGQGAAWLWWVGVPYLAVGGWPMRQGVLEGRAMGLPEPAWSSWAWLEMTSTGFLVGVLLFFVWVGMRGLVTRAYRIRRIAAPRADWRRFSVWKRLLEVIALDAHWAFYWAAMSVVLDDRYAGLWAGLALMFAEWAADPWWRDDLSNLARAPRRWQRMAAALGVALIFWQTGNLWICICIHWLMEMVLQRFPLAPVAAGAAP
jgi:hypothetical protein